MPLLSPNRSASAFLKPAPMTPTQSIENIAIEPSKALNTYNDTRWVSAADMLSFVEGASWIIGAYYSQVLNTDTALSGQQINRDPVYQSYRKIVDLKLKVTSALSDQQDEVTKAMQVTGTSMIPSVIIPNRGDMFVADIGEGRTGIFKVTSSNKKSHFKNSVYEITYILITDDSVALTDLQTKTVSEFIYDEQSYRHSTDPLVLPSAMLTRKTINKLFPKLLHFYLTRFFSQEHKTFIVPGQEYDTYEHYLSRFFKQNFDMADNFCLSDLHVLQTGDRAEYDSPSVWDAITQRNASILDTCFNKIMSITNDYFSVDPMMSSLRYSGMLRSVYPIDSYYSINAGLKRYSGYDLALELEAVQKDSNYDNSIAFEANTQVTHSTERDVLKDACLGGYYVFSQAFYNQTQTNTLEDLVLKYIHQESLDTAVVLDAAQRMHKWNTFEQFYYGPFILLAMKAISQGVVL